MPVVSMKTYFKTYFNITTQPYYVATGPTLQAFLTAHIADIMANDPDFSTQVAMSYVAYSGNTENGVGTTQKWVQPVTLGSGPLLLPTMQIAMILYKNDGVEELLLRVPNASIDPLAGYPGVP